MKILVTGANGYLGTGIVKQLLDDGMEVIAADFTIENIDKRAKAVACDLFTIEEPFLYFDKPDVLLHLAWKDGFKHDSLSHIHDMPKHYDFVTKFIDKGIERICILGSMHEIGFYEGSIDESTPTKPQSLYGISKNALREAIKLEADKKGTIFQWIRGYYIVGNTLAGCSIFSKITQAENDGKKEFPFTMGVNQYDFLDYEEFCFQVAAVVEQDVVIGIINCCSGIPERLGARVERFIKDNNYSIKLKYGAFPDRPYDSKAVWGNNQKINEIIDIRNNVVVNS